MPFILAGKLANRRLLVVRAAPRCGPGRREILREDRDGNLVQAPDQEARHLLEIQHAHTSLPVRVAGSTDYTPERETANAGGAYSLLT